MPGGRFIAHRRLTHRLVRAMRRVAEPLVFEPNGPELWSALARGVTTVLVEAYRSGALRGANPAEAFTVRCDSDTTTDEDQGVGRVVCEVAFVPANPMEVITIRLLLAPDGRLEVIEQ
jgi:phage tail sheath protein FI